MNNLKEKLMNAGGLYSYITITSDNNVLIEGCEQIIECSEVLAKVATKLFTVEILGSELKVNCFSNGTVSVFGTVRTVSLERKRQGEIR